MEDTMKRFRSSEGMHTLVCEECDNVPMEELQKNYALTFKNCSKCNGFVWGKYERLAKR
jgi:hydrogenase maturation factor HypF (carbamoyltransferase family)